MELPPPSSFEHHLRPRRTAALAAAVLSISPLSSPYAHASAETYQPHTFATAETDANTDFIPVLTKATAEDMVEDPTPVLVPRSDITINGEKAVAIPVGDRLVDEEDESPSSVIDNEEEMENVIIAEGELVIPEDMIEPDTMEVPSTDLKQGRHEKAAPEKYAPVLKEYGMPEQFISLYVQAGKEFDVSPLLLAAQTKLESSFNPNAQNPSGASGFGQFMPDTWQKVVRDLKFPADVSPFDPNYAVRGQAYYMGQMLDSGAKLKESQDLDPDVISLALAGYNAGFRSVEDYQGVPPSNRVRSYVKTISQDFKQMSGKLAPPSTPPPSSSPSPKPSTNKCAPGTESLGVYATSRGAREMCAINGLPSSSEESTPSSGNYMKGAEGRAIVSAQDSHIFVKYVQKAKRDGVKLSANSSFRAAEHQQRLCQANALCRKGIHTVVGSINGSSHRSGSAIDFDRFKVRNTVSNCKNDGANGCGRPGDPMYEWLMKTTKEINDEAGEKVVRKYSKEFWHFDTKKR